jgi:uncharacterized membrane protein YhaH (DUF805 family)
MGRRAFLLAYVCWVFAVGAVMLATGNKTLAEALGLLPWLWMATRRLHDFNARWWWSLAPFAVGFVGGFVGGIVERFATAHAAEFSAAYQTQITTQIDWAGVVRDPWDFLVGFAQGFSNAVAARFAAHPFGALLDTVFLIVLMFWPGTAGANRFGDPPGRRGAPPADPVAVSATFD